MDNPFQVDGFGMRKTFVLVGLAATWCNEVMTDNITTEMKWCLMGVGGGPYSNTSFPFPERKGASRHAYVIV